MHELVTVVQVLKYLIAVFLDYFIFLQSSCRTSHNFGRMVTRPRQNIQQPWIKLKITLWGGGGRLEYLGINVQHIVITFLYKWLISIRKTFISPSRKQLFVLNYMYFFRPIVWYSIVSLCSISYHTISKYYSIETKVCCVAGI